MRKRIAAGILSILAAVMMAGAAMAYDFHGWTLPDALEAEGQDLMLNGAGFRSKYFLKIYVGALYLTSKRTDPSQIIYPEEPMGVRMLFTFKDVPKQKFLDTLETGFAKSTKGGVAPIRQRMDKLFASLPRGFSKNEYLDIIYHPGRGTVITYNGQTLVVIPGLDFKQAMFGIWLGDEPVTEKLKNEMLGRVES